MKRKNNWKTISSKIVHKNPWYSIQKDDVILPNGKNGEYFIIKTGDSSFVIPIKDDKIIFVRQYRYVFDDWFLELPGGAVEKGETPMQAATKELHEEAGYTSKDIKEVGTFVPLTGALEEVTHVFVAKDIQFIGQKLEASEYGLEIVEINIDDIDDMIKNGDIIDGQTISSLTLAKQYIL